RTLQARIGKLPLPAAMYAQVQFKPDGPRSRFDFTFENYSKEPVATATPTMTSAAPPAGALAAPAVSAPAATPANSADPSAAAVDPALLTLPIPDTVPE